MISDYPQTHDGSAISPQELLGLASHGLEPSHLGALNLLPYTLDEYMQLRDSIEDKYELVDGLLLWREMPDRDHLDIQAFLYQVILHGHADNKFDICIYREAPVNFAKPYEVGSDKNCRIADIAIGNYDTPEVRRNYSPNSKKNPFSVKRLPNVVIEITSPSNRKNDIDYKWKQYAKYKIPEYYIVDRQEKCVVRGYFGQGQAYLTGETKIGEREPVHSKSKSDYRNYCIDVFRDNDPIGGHFLGKLNICAELLLQPPYVGDWLRDLEKQRQKALEEARKETEYYKALCKEAEAALEDVKDRLRSVVRVLENDAKRLKFEKEKLKSETAVFKEKVDGVYEEMGKWRDKIADPKLFKDLERVVEEAKEMCKNG